MRLRMVGGGLARRGLILGATVGLWAGSSTYARSLSDQTLASLELSSGGRLGLYAFDVGSGRAIAHRADQRFPMCSTFKALAVAALLHQVDSGAQRLDRKIAYGAADLLSYAPVAHARLGEGGLSLSDLCAAAITLSDNTAANLILAEIGGPEGLTQWLRALGDPATRLDRNEPALNSSIPGDPRDTTTPHAMAQTLGKLLLTDALKPASRALLLGWMRGCTTGLTKLRAGLPGEALVGDKTGNNGHDTCGDVAIVDLPGRKPILIAAYLTEAKVDAKAQDAILAAVARRVMAEFRAATRHG